MGRHHERHEKHDKNANGSLRIRPGFSGKNRKKEAGEEGRAALVAGSQVKNPRKAFLFSQEREGGTIAAGCGRSAG
jgi:hypothetical protein